MIQSPDYLRISLTDRCNLRCVYCHPGDGTGCGSALSADAVERFVRLAAKCGIIKIRLTGGEPLVHPEIIDIVARISKISGIEKVGMTTNGTLLAKKAEKLRRAGLNAINISMPSLRPEVYSRITGGGNPADALAGLEAALRYGIESVKLNTVILRGMNDEEIEAIASLARDERVETRFIEYMPFDDSPCVMGAVGDDLLVGGDEILARLSALGEMREIPITGAAAAVSYAIEGFMGRVGLIRSITRPFCAGCRRLRLTSNGKLRACLVEGGEVDVNAFLSGENEDPDALAKVFSGCAGMKPERHSGSFTGVMTCIGG